MRVLLMYPDRDFRHEAVPSTSTDDDLIRDLGLEVVFEAASSGDPVVETVLRSAIRAKLTSLGEILYRQAILADCISAPGTVRDMYAVAAGALDAERRVFRGLLNTPSSVLSASVRSMEVFIPGLRRLREIADRAVGEVTSPGLRRLLGAIREELSDEFFMDAQEHLRRLAFRDGVLMSADLGLGGRPAQFVVRTPAPHGVDWRALVGLAPKASYSFQLDRRDEAGARALSALRDRGVNLIANALGQSADHVRGFLAQLVHECAFYVGCLNLRDRLAARGSAVCMPEPLAAQAYRHAVECREVYDVALALQSDEPVYGNELHTDALALLVITGANSGGKSTFLRSIGQAQLMMQSGMFVAAERWRASVRSGIFSHFVRDEDESMTSGRLDEEMARMSGIVHVIEPGSLILFNESFAGTNEREGSEIARQIMEALLESGVTVACVTHLYSLARGLYERRRADAVFMRAECEADGRRTFRIVPGEPLATSHGRDLLVRMGGWGAPDAQATPRPRPPFRVPA